MADTKSITISGDKLTVNWTGSVWQSPSTGEQFAHARDAMRVEVAAYLTSCGVYDADEVEDAIAGM